MKKIYVVFFITFAIMLTSCGSSDIRSNPSNNTVVSTTSYSGASSHEQKAAMDTAYVTSEPMKIWINPIEYQLEIDESVGNKGYIEVTWPKPGNDADSIESYDDYYYGKNASSNLMTANVQFKDASVTFDSLSPKAKRAILYIIKEYGLDGFFVTMIDEFTGTLSQTETSQTYKTEDGQEKKNSRVTTKTKTIINIRGIALKLKYLGPVSPERADKVRQTPQTYIYR